MTDATKALAAASAIIEAGNDIVLSKRKGGSYIENLKTKERVYLRKKGGTYVFDVEWEEEIDDAYIEMDEESTFSRRG